MERNFGVARPGIGEDLPGSIAIGLLLNEKLLSLELKGGPKNTVTLSSNSKIIRLLILNLSSLVKVSMLDLSYYSKLQRLLA